MTTPVRADGSKRFLLLTYGSRGAVEPLVALGLGLRQAGHSVRLVAPRPFEFLAHGYGLDFSPLEGDPEQLALALTDRAGLSWPLMVARMIQHVLPIAAAVFDQVRQAAGEADVIIHTFMMAEVGHTLAAQHNLPDFSAQLFPVFVPTSAFPAVAFPDIPLGAPYRRLTHILSTAVFRFGGRLLYRRVRANRPDLPDLAPWPFAGAAGAVPILFGFSPSVLPPPPDWPGYVAVTGYWHLPPPSGWAPPERLLEFLRAGPPPIYFGLGSMRSRRMPDLLRTMSEAILSTGQRGMFGVTPEELRAIGDVGPVRAVAGIPHAWLFPQAGLVIHHGGAGTTGAGLRAG